MTKNQYYQHQKEILEKAFEQYGENHPTIRSKLHLNDHLDRDPSVKRLLEGVAYLSGEIERVAKKNLARMTTGLLNQLEPKWCEALPSSVVAKIATVNEAQTMPMDAIFESKTGIQFVSKNEINLLPIKSVEIKWAHALSKKGFQLIVKKQSNKKFNQNHLDLYIDASNETASLIVYLLTEKSSSIDRKNHYFSLMAFEACQNDLYKTTHLVKQFFNYKPSIMFVRLHNLIEEDFVDNQAILNFEIKGESIAQDTSKVKLHANCVVLSNQIDTVIEPILISENRDCYPLLINSSNPHQQSILSINATKAKENFSDQVLELNPLEHYIVFDHQNSAGKYEPYLRLLNPMGDNFVLSCSATVCDEMKAHDTLSTQDVLTGRFGGDEKEAVLLTRPSRFSDYKISENEMDRYLTLFSTTMTTFKNAESLKSFLNCLTKPLRLETANRVIDAIQKLSQRQTIALKKGVHYPLQLFEIKLNDSAFANPGEKCLFVNLIKTLLQAYIPINQKGQVLTV